MKPGAVRLLHAAIAAVATACTSSDAAHRSDNADAHRRQAGYVVDSILPMEEHLRRFRAGSDSTGGLSGGAPGLDELVRRFVAAVEARDTAGLAAMALTRAEFAWLLFPAHPFGRPPYEMPPGLFWLQVQAGSSRGLSRVLEQFGGRRFGDYGLACEAVSGAMALAPPAVAHQCKVVLRRAGGDADTVRLFGSIVEWAGQFKYVSYANEL